MDTFYASIVENPYWSRIWIIQEIMFGHNIIIQCGQIQVEWDAMSEVFLRVGSTIMEEESNLERSQSSLMDTLQRTYRSNAGNLFYWKAKFNQANPLFDQEFTLYQLVKRFRFWDCTDVRDKVFALCGLAIEHTRIPVNYAKATEDIYQELCSKIFDIELDYCRYQKRLQVVGVLAEALGQDGLSLMKRDVWNCHSATRTCHLPRHTHQIRLGHDFDEQLPEGHIFCPRQGMVNVRDFGSFPHNASQPGAAAFMPSTIEHSEYAEDEQDFEAYDEDEGEAGYEQRYGKVYQVD